MPKFFNIAGPCIPGEHYLVPALARLPELSGLIGKKQYFVIHAARQLMRAKLQPISWVSSRRLCRWTTGSCQ